LTKKTNAQITNCVLESTELPVAIYFAIKVKGQMSRSNSPTFNHTVKVHHNIFLPSFINFQWAICQFLCGKTQRDAQPE